MANDNETVEQVLERMTRGMGRDCSVECQLLESDVVEYANRILTAHNREMAAKYAMIAEQSAVNESQAAQLRDALNEISAKDRQLELASADAEAADAEIDKLKFDNMRLKSEQRTAAECIIEQTNKVEEKDAEIENLKKENAQLRVINCGNYYADEQLRDELAAKDAEIARLRTLIEGLFAASATECADCRYDCGPNRENCIIHEAANYIKKVEVEND